MRAAQERNQERLPPKKRDLPAATGQEAAELGAERAAGLGGGGGGSSTGGGEASAASPGEWAPSRYGAGGASEGVAGLTVDQYGLLYKVAVPPVVSVSPLPPAFGVPHPALSYPPVHFAQLPPAPLHFVGSSYPVPYAAVPPGFLPGPLLPASRIPHLVPYTPLLLEEATPPAHGFDKAAATLSLLGSGQAPGGSQPLEVGQSRLPVQYQLAQLPAGYSAFEVPFAHQGLDLPLRGPKLITANGVEGPAAGTKPNEVLEADGGGAEGRLPRTKAESTTDGRFFTGCLLPRTEVSTTSHRSTPDTDLEVQRVVGVFASQDYLACSGQQKEGSSPLNLSHRDFSEQGEESGRNPGQAAAEKSHLQRLSANSPEELLYHDQILRGLAMANGKSVSGPLLPATQDALGRGDPEAPTQGPPLELDRAPSQSRLPSHFMKGAIIQLATGELKRVEDLQTQDFVRSAEVSGGLKIDSSTVVDIQGSPWQGFVTLHFVVGEQRSKVSIDVPPEHPFFVYGQGWSSCSPERTARLFALPCHRLQVGDVCISISLQSLNGRLAPQATQGAPREGLGRVSQGSQEPQVRAGGGSPMQKGAMSMSSPSESSPHLEPTTQHGWAGPSFQRFGEESRSPLIRPSFIPQEVKLSIEGRSNAGK